MAALLLWLVAAWLSSAAAEELAVVRLRDGSRLLGVTTATARTGRPVYEFRGVRYARAPGGQDRFKPARPAGPLGNYNATMFQPPCPPAFPWSNDWFTDPAPEVAVNVRMPREDEDMEDCLFLNVFTPTLNASARMAVLVHVHGGSYIAGTPLLARPGFMLEHDLLLVTVQYRLFVLGFLYLDTEEVPGNMGLADMTAALRWVRDNIASFGGDPNRVTVAGGSAGAAAAEFLAYSPVASGLFHQVLPMSGSAHAAWAMETPEDALSEAKGMAEQAGCDSPDVHEIVNCLRSISLDNITMAFMNQAASPSTDQLVQYYTSYWIRNEDRLVATTPVVQRRQLTATPVLTHTPRQLCAPGSGYQGRPMLVSVTKHDGHFFVSHGISVWLEGNYSETERIYRMKAFMQRNLKSDYDPVIADALFAKYFKKYSDSEDVLIALTDFIGASKFKGPMMQSADCNVRHGGRTFVYTLSHRGSYKNKGIEHGIDVLYLSPRSDFNLSEEDELVSRRLVHLHANFIMYGHPTPDVSPVEDVPHWPEYEPRGGPYMRVDWPFRVQHDFEAHEFDITSKEGFGGGAALTLQPAAALIMVVWPLRQLVWR